MKGKNVLVAGGSGLVGVHLTRRLVALGANVLATRYSQEPPDPSDRYRRFDLTVFGDCLEATKGIDRVFICAAKSFGSQVMKESPSVSILPNLNINAGLLEASRINRVGSTVLVSSSTVYPESYRPLLESDLDLNAPPHPLYQGVGWVNRYCEQLARFYVDRYGMNVGIVRPTNIYGPSDKTDPEKANVIPALIMKALDRENPFGVRGDGNEVRDFLYVEDFVDDLILVMEKHCTGDPVNVASDQPTSVRETVRIILDACGHSVEPVYGGEASPAIRYRVLSTRKYESLFGPARRTGLREGIGKTATWYREKRRAAVR